MPALSGLTSEEVNQRRKIFGNNIIEMNGRRSNFILFLRQFSSPIVLLLISATLVSIVVGDTVSGLIILGIIIPSGFLGFWQEYKAGKIIDTLLHQISIHTEVIRDGREISIPASEVVPGDCVILRVGDLVPADALISQSSNLLIDESVLTGESFPREISGTQQIFQGSHVVSGQAIATVTAIGKTTKFGRVIGSINQSNVTTGFEKGLTRFGGLLIKSTLILVVLVFALNLILQRPIIDSLLFSLALAVGLTPQLLPVIVSVSLSIGARQMAKEDVLVKRLDAIEDLGQMNILCTDKTGTLTTGQVQVVSAIDISRQPSQRVKTLAYINASLQSGFENPIDRAIVATNLTINPKVAAVAEISYDFTRRKLSVLTDYEGGVLITKGAYKEVLESCDFVRHGDEIVNVSLVLDKLKLIFESMSMNGNRVICVASRKFPLHLTPKISDESHMIFEGFLELVDPPKAGATKAIEGLRSQGIDIYLLTGDNSLAANCLGQKVGLGGQVMTGAEVEGKTPEELAQIIQKVRIFAAVDPIQKKFIVEALRLNGATVGFFGDGINDAPALQAADIGISVDTGVDAAKAAASVVLLQKDLSVLSHGILLGRRTFTNTLKYIRVGVSAAFGNVFSMAIANIFLPFLPLLPAQILLLNFMTDFPAVTISGDHVDKESLSKPTSWDIALIRKLMIIFGLISTIFDLATFATLHYGFNASPELFRTGWFVESAFTEFTVLLVLRTNRPFWRSVPGKGLLLSSIILATLVLCLPFTPFGSTMGFVQPPKDLLLVLAGLIAIYVSINEVAKRIWWR